MTPYLKILYLVCGSLNLMIALFVAIKHYKTRSSRHFVYFLMSTIFWTASLYLGYLYTSPHVPEKSLFYIRGAYGTSIFMGFFLVSFFYLFPKKTFQAPLYVKWLFLLVTAALAFLSSATGLVHEEQVVQEGVYVADKLGPLYMWYLFYFVATLIGAGIIAISKVLKSSGLERKKMLIAAVGCWIFLFFGVVINVILPLFHIYVLPKQAVMFVLFFTLPTFYSMQKYRFFNFSYSSMAVFRWVILLSGFLLPLFVIQLNFHVFVPGAKDELVILVSGLLALLFFTVLTNFFPNLLGERYRRFKSIVDHLRSRIYYCETHEALQDMLEEAFAIKANIENVKLCVVRENDDVKLDIPVYKRNKFTAQLEKSSLDIVILEEIQYLELNEKAKNLLKEGLSKLESDLCLPLYSEKKLVGMLLFGSKSTPHSYSREEIEQLLTIGPNISVCLMNILLQKNLQEENDLMKRVIREKTKELQHQFEEIKRLLNLQSDFLAVTAHEFRTPLSIAMFQLEDTMDSRKLPPDLEKEMEVLDSSLSNLKNLTQKLFDVQQYDLNKVELNKSKVPIKKYVKSIYEEFIPIMEEAKIKFKFSQKVKGKVDINMDGDQMRQVLHNILTNAKKFIDPKTGKIELAIVEDSKHAIIKIIDNGKGIPDEDKERLFEKFQTKKNTKGMGIGLGLYLCRKIVELHKGKIWIEDTPGGGATFNISLRK